MPARVQKMGDTIDNREFSPTEIMFVCNLKLVGKKYPKIQQLFSEKFGKPAPSRNGTIRMVGELRKEFTVLTLRKESAGRKFTVWTAQNIDAVKRSLARTPFCL